MISILCFLGILGIVSFHRLNLYLFQLNNNYSHYHPSGITEHCIFYMLLLVIICVLQLFYISASFRFIIFFFSDFLSIFFAFLCVYFILLYLCLSLMKCRLSLVIIRFCFGSVSNLETSYFYFLSSLPL